MTEPLTTEQDGRGSSPSGAEGIGIDVPLRCSYPPRFVAESDTPTVPWEALRTLVPGLPRDKDFHPFERYYRFVYIITARPRMVRIGVSEKPKEMVSYLGARQTVILAQAVTGSSPHCHQLRAIVPTRVVKTGHIITDTFADEALGNSWFRGPQVSRLVDTLVKKGYLFQDLKPKQVPL